MSTEYLSEAGQRGGNLTSSILSSSSIRQHPAESRSESLADRLGLAVHTLFPPPPPPPPPPEPEPRPAPSRDGTELLP